LVRAYANIADELDRAGYDAPAIVRIKQQLDHYLDVREIIRNLIIICECKHLGKPVPKHVVHA
jgi:hypothetical protein